jgi:hypothetical protein
MISILDGKKSTHTDKSTLSISKLFLSAFRWRTFSFVIGRDSVAHFARDSAVIALNAAIPDDITVANIAITITITTTTTI